MQTVATKKEGKPAAFNIPIDPELLKEVQDFCYFNKSLGIYQRDLGAAALKLFFSLPEEEQKALVLKAKEGK
jgi:hypothetical protein